MIGVKYSCNKGFTLIEMMVVVGIIAITMGIGLPNFQSAVASNRLTSSVNDMVVALQMARSESIKQMKFTGVVFNSSESWDTVIVGSSSNTVVQSFNASTGVTLSVTSGTVAAGDIIARYRSDGRVVSNADIVMQFSVSGVSQTRTITVKPSGRVSLS